MAAAAAVGGGFQRWRWLRRAAVSSGGVGAVVGSMHINHIYIHLSDFKRFCMCARTAAVFNFCFLRPPSFLFAKLFGLFALGHRPYAHHHFFRFSLLFFMLLVFSDTKNQVQPHDACNHAPKTNLVDRPHPHIHVFFAHFRHWSFK